MDEDDFLLARPSTKVRGRPMFGTSAVEDTVFQLALSTSVPTREKVLAEPTKAPQVLSELESKNKTLDDIRYQSALESHDPYMRLIGKSSPAVPEAKAHTSLLEAPKLTLRPAARTVTTTLRR